MSDSVKKIKVTLVKSVIGAVESHRACVRGLGLRKTGQSRLLVDTPANRGMVNKVNYLVKMETV